MAGNTVDIKLRLTAEGVAANVKAAKDTADEYARANKELARTNSLRQASGPAPRSAAARSAPSTSSVVTEQEYGKVRGAVGTGAAGRDFAKQAQGLGGLVGLYATFAANIFAVGAAYTALDKAAATERLAKATEMMSVSTGIHLKAVSKNLVEASGYALSFSEAMQFTNIGTSAGLASSQIQSLTKIAKGAANALGRDVGDSVRRIIQGTAKQEQEILDELGIFAKASQAYAKFSEANKIKVSELTGAQRVQAYANEVERLGAKWNEFAEIPDPFSKFAATGKNALNELLATVNKVFVPFISFLSESKDGIQALIVLITAGLTKRALPELSNVISNLFTFDKARIAKEAKDAQQSLVDAYADTTAKLAANKKIRDALIIPTVTREDIISSVGNLSTTTKDKGGIGSNRLATAFVGTTPNPLTDITKYTKIEQINASIEKSIHAQLMDTKFKDDALKGMIAKGILANDSTLVAVTLGEKGLKVSEDLLKKISETNVGLARKVALESESLALTQQQKADKRNLGSTPIPTEVIAKSASTSVAATAATNASTASTIAATTANTANAASTVAATAATTVNSASVTTNTAAQTANTSGILSRTKAQAVNLTVMEAYNKGLATSTVFQTTMTATGGRLGAQLALIGKEMLVAASAALAFGTSAASASAAAGLLGASFRLVSLSIKGVLAALSAVAMPLLLAWTAWELFGDKIKEWLGYDSKAQKALEEQTKRLKEYEEGTTLAAVSMERINRARAKSIESIEEKSRWDNIELKIIQEQLSRKKSLADAETAEADKVTQEAANAKAAAAGITFSGEAYLAEQRAKAASMEGDAQKAAELLKLASAYQQLANAKAITDKNPNAATGVSKAYEDELKGTIALDAKRLESRGVQLQQEESKSNKLKNLNKSFLDAIDHATTESLKKGSKELGIHSEKAVAAYTQLTSVFSSGNIEAMGLQDTFSSLGVMISNGGVQAGAALPMYLALAKILTDPKSSTKEGLAALLKENEEALKSGALAVGKALDTGKPPPPPKAIVPYDEKSKNLFAALKNDIDETSLKLKQLSGEQAASAAIDARLTSIRGVTSVEAISTTKRLADKQAELSLQKENTNAILDYEKVIKDRSKIGKEGVAAKAEAEASLKIKQKDIQLTKEQADKLSYTSSVTSLISLSTTAQTLELKKQADLETISRGYAQQRLDAKEAELSYATDLGYLTSKEIVDAQYLLEVEKQKLAVKGSLVGTASTFQGDIAPQLAILATPGSTPDDLAGKELARAKLLEIEAVYQKQNALILSGAEGLALQTARAHDLKSALAGGADNMDKMKSVTESLAVIFGSLGASVGAAGEALLKMSQDEEKHGKAKLEAEKKTANARDNAKLDPGGYKDALKKEIDIDKKATKDKLSNIGNVAGATKKMFKEHTGAYKVLATVEKATHAFKVAMQIKEMAIDAAAFLKKIFFVQAEVPVVAGATAAKTGLELAGQAATMPAKIAGIYASFMSMLGPFGPPAAALAIAAFIGSFSGGSKSAPMPGGFTAEDQQKSQGTGQSWGKVDGKDKLVENGRGVFGDASAKSESISNSLEIMKANSIEGLDYDNQMLKAMERVADAIGIAAVSIYQIQGIRAGSAFGTEEGTSGKTMLGWGKARSTSIEDSGIKLQGTFAQLADSASKAAMIYENIKTETRKKTWFSDKTNTRFDTNLLDLEREQAKAISDIFVNATSVFIEIGKTAGVTETTIRSKLAALNIYLAASTRGLTGEDLAKELNAVLGSALSIGAKDIFIQFDKYKKFGEDYLQTAVRVVDGNKKVDQALRGMGSTFDVTVDSVKRLGRGWFRFMQTTSKFDISEALIKGAGGLDKFMEQASTFTSSFLSDEERLAPIQEAVSERLKELGLSSTLSRDSFKNLVLAQDLSSDSGRKMYQNLMELAPGFDEVTKAADGVAEKAKEVAKRLAAFEEAIYKLRGDTGKALQLARARELEETDVRLRASQTYVWALEDEISIKDKLTTSINTNISSLKANIKTVTDYSEKIKLGASSVMTPAQKYAEAKGQLGDIYALASSNPVTEAEKLARNEAVGKLSSASETFLTMSKTMFASSEQYVQDYQAILQMLGAVQVGMTGQLTDAEKQLEEVRTSNSYLKNMDANTYTTAQLMQQFLTAASASETARVAAGASGSLAALAIPARANGGYASGLTLVGEKGPELANFTKPAMVYSNAASNDLLNTKELVAEIRSLHKELAQLRKDQQEQTGHLIATNYDANQKAAAQVTKSSESVAATDLWVQRSQPKIA